MSLLSFIVHMANITSIYGGAVMPSQSAGTYSVSSMSKSAGAAGAAGALGGAGSQSTPLKPGELLSLQQNSMIKSALNQVTAEQLPEKYAKAFIPGYNGNNLYCDKRGVEGNWQVANEEAKKQCIANALDKREKAKALAKTLVEGDTSKACVTKFDKKQMMCHTRNLLKNIVNNPFFSLKVYGNVVALEREGNTEMMAVVENIKYDVTEKVKKRPSALNKPTVELLFNAFGSLLKQSGELPSAKKEDPCQPCLMYLNQKSVEGTSEACGGCQSLSDLTSATNDSFRIKARVGDSGDTSGGNNGGSGNGQSKVTGEDADSGQ